MGEPTAPLPTVPQPTPEARPRPAAQGWLAVLTPRRAVSGAGLAVRLARTRLYRRGGQRPGRATRSAADTEQRIDQQRRIERDPHGWQQPRLVSLALELSIARSRFERDKDCARALLERAHGEGTTAIQDLRSLTRGIHPSVPGERGLGDDHR